jgi:hypothetical protein
MNGDNMTVKEIAEHIISQRDLRHETPNIVRLAEAFLQLSPKDSPREASQSTIDWWEDTNQQDVAANLGIKIEQLTE